MTALLPVISVLAVAPECQVGRREAAVERGDSLMTTLPAPMNTLPPWMTFVAAQAERAQPARRWFRC
jgi:hypothetical protein